MFKAYWGVLKVHWRVLKVHLGVSIGVILAHFKGFWVLRRKHSTLRSNFLEFLKKCKKRGILMGVGIKSYH